MAEFDDKLKLRVVIALAQFERPSDIAKELAAEGIETDPKQIGGYDPTRTYFVAGDRWKEIFEEERKRYLTDVQSVPIANQGYRLQILQKTLDGAVRSGNKVLANQTLEQAAKEVGGALTNERNLKVTKPLDETSADERRAMFAELVAKALEARDPPGTQPTAPGVQ